MNLQCNYFCHFFYHVILPVFFHLDPDPCITDAINLVVDVMESESIMCVGMVRKTWLVVVKAV